MPEALTTFRYRALTRAGEKISGEVTARDRGAAIARLQAQGLIPLLAEAVDGASLAAFLRRDLFGSATLSAKELADFMQEFATLAGAGIAVEQALATLAGPEAGRKRRRIAEDLLRRLRGGASLADAMAAEPKTFPPLALGMVRAGEAGGSLETGLTRLADYLRRSADVGEAVRNRPWYIRPF
jgi:general secretion pathway protein F